MAMYELDDELVRVVRAQKPNGFTAVYLRWADEAMNAADPWIQQGDYDRDCFDTDDIGRITEVLSEGVDL